MFEDVKISICFPRRAAEVLNFMHSLQIQCFYTYKCKNIHMNTSPAAALSRAPCPPHPATCRRGLLLHAMEPLVHSNEVPTGAPLGQPLCLWLLPVTPIDAANAHAHHICSPNRHCLPTPISDHPGWNSAVDCPGGHCQILDQLLYHLCLQGSWGQRQHQVEQLFAVTTDGN